MDPKTGIHEPMVTIPTGMDCRKLNWMAILENKVINGVKEANKRFAEDLIGIKGSK